MSMLLEELTRHLPGMLVRRHAHAPEAPVAPHAERLPAAVLFADVSGFTTLTDRLERNGPAGAETLAALLNDCLGPMIELITAHGGDIVQFAGDAFIALWPAEDLPLEQATRRAALCGLAIQGCQSRIAPVDGQPLSLRVVIGAGDVSFAQLGGVFGRWECLLAGDPLSQVKRLEPLAPPGQVVLSPEARTIAGDAVSVAPLTTGSRDPSGVILLSLVRPLEPRPLELPRLADEATAALRAYIPGALLSRLAAGHSSWIAELRRITVVFVQLPELDLRTDARLEQAQVLLQVAQATIYRYEGSLNKLCFDEKGTMLVAVFGLPPFAHEDDAVRGARAAIALREALASVGGAGGIGVATGRAFCGTVGNGQRCEYTVLGDVVNLAARLMVAARGGILCDDTTFQGARGRLLFEALPALQVKGRESALGVFRPQGELRRATASPRALVGRRTELAALIDPVHALLRRGATHTVVLEGEGGLGKSRLLDELDRQARALGVQVIRGLGEAIERTTPYFAWRAVFTQLLGLETAVDAGDRRRRARERLADRPEDLELLPLLNGLLALELPETAQTRRLAGPVRAENTRTLLYRLLERAVARSPSLLVLEDAHCFDSASWGLLERVQAQLRPLCLVIASRPIVDAVPAEYRRILERPWTRQVRLGPLPADETVAFVCQRLGVVSLPDEARLLICQRAEGHPFFAEELALALRDAGLLLIEGTSCRVAPSAGDLRVSSLPGTLEAVITSRIDRLTPSQQLTLKVASVIGRTFGFHLLADVHPLEAERDEIPNDLNILERLDLTPLHATVPEPTYAFKHAIAHEAVYSLMTFAQRRQLHRRVADWYERRFAADLSPLYPLLAWHHTRADDIPRALEYLEKAGDQALESYANHEAVAFFGQALTLSVRAEAKVSDLRLARWERRLGEAYLALGRVEEGRTHLERAVALIDRPRPAGKAGLSLHLVAELGRLFVNRLTAGSSRAWAASEDADRREALVEAARAWERLAEVYYFTNEQATMIHATLRALNLAARSGPSPELSRCYANVSFMAGLVSMHRLAWSLGAEAVGIARRIDDPASLAWARLVTGLYLQGTGRWSDSDPALEEALQISRRLNDSRRLEETLSTLAQSLYHRGRFVEALEPARELEQVSRRTRDIQLLSNGLTLQLVALISLERWQEAEPRVEALEALLPGDLAPLQQIGSYGVLAMYYQARGDQRRAVVLADLVSALLGDAPPTSDYSLLGYLGVAMVHITRFSSPEPCTADERRVRTKAARRAVDGLFRYAKLFPVGLPRAWHWRGVFEAASGLRGRALRTWRRAVALGQKLQMPFSEAQSRLELGRYLPAGDPEQAEQIERAQALFAALDATGREMLEEDASEPELSEMPAKSAAAGAERGG